MKVDQSILARRFARNWGEKKEPVTSEVTGSCIFRATHPLILRFTFSRLEEHQDQDNHPGDHSNCHCLEAVGCDDSAIGSL